MVEFETDRLIDRNFGPQDASDLLAYLHRPTASCFFALAVEDLHAAEIEARKRGAGDDYLAICLKSDSRVIGDVFAIPDQPDTFGVGWNLNPRFGKLGYAFEAAKALFGDLFASRGARRLQAYVDEGNSSSERLCRRLGMRQEGLFREFISFETDADGKAVFVDTKQFAILRHEWS